MSGDLWQMARNGTTLLPSEVKKLAADYDRLRRILNALKEPSDDVVDAAMMAQWQIFTADQLAMPGPRSAGAAIQAAVAAAEQEA